MSSIDKALKYMEKGIRDADGPSRIYGVIDQLEEHNPNFFLRFWEALLEFKTPKIQRSTFVADTNIGERDISINVIDDKGQIDEYSGNTSIPPNIEG